MNTVPIQDAGSVEEAAREAREEIARGSEELIDLLRELVRVPSVFGQEGKCQTLVAEKLEDFCDSVDIWEPRQSSLEGHPSYFCPGVDYTGRPNVVGVLKGSGNGRSLIINAHVDVVGSGDPSTWQHPPWDGCVEGLRLYGRGACDTKGGMAAAIYALKVLRKLGVSLRGDVIFESVSGEEWGGGGTLATLLKGYIADAALVVEPTNLRICPICRGGAIFQVYVQGKGAHPINSQSGISAIEKAMVILSALKNLQEIRREKFEREIFGKRHNLTPLVVGSISAEIPQKVPEKCIIKGVIGYPPEESYEEVKRELEGYLATVSRLDPWLLHHPASVTWEGYNKEGSKVEPDTPIISTLSEAFQDVLGVGASLDVFPASCDAHFFTRYWGIPAVILGPGDCTIAHTSNEYVDVNEVINFAKILATTILRWCS